MAGIRIDVAHNVDRMGWLRLQTSLPRDHFDDEILRLARTLGEPCAGRSGRVLEKLSPLQPSMAKTKSLSAAHGVKTLPMHIDGAHLTEPPHFIILACKCPDSSPVPTVLVRFDELGLTSAELQECEAAPFLVRNGRRSFYSTISSPFRPFLRFDQECMSPVTRAASDVSRSIAACVLRSDPAIIDWAAGDIVIIDNWRVLHGRGLQSSAASTDRRLIRVSVQ